MSTGPSIAGEYIKLPSLTSTERDAIATPANGMMIYNSTTATLQKYEGGVWASFGGTSTSFADNTFFITDNSDSSKKIAFEASGITTGTTRTQTVQDANGTLQLNASGNIIPNSSFEVWERGIAAAPDGWVLTGASATVAQEGTLIKHGLYSAKITRSGTNCHLSADIYALGGKTYMRSRVYTLGAWVYATSASKVRLRVNDGTTTTNSSYHSGGSTWEYLTCSFTVNSGATALNVGLAVDTGDTSGYIDGVVIAEGLSTPNYIPSIREVNHLKKRDKCDHCDALVVAGNALAKSHDTSQNKATYSFQNTSAQNDAFTHSVNLAAGTYTMTVLGVTNVSHAQVDWYIDGVRVVTAQDWYSASQVFNVLKTASVTVVGDGEHIIKGIAATRNGSNTTGWNLVLTDYEFHQSAD